MNRWLQGFSLAGLTLFLCACETTTYYQNSIDSWQGTSINKLTRVWGYPQRKTQAPNGNDVYIYERDRSFTTPETCQEGKTTIENDSKGNKTITTVPPRCEPAQYHQQTCATWFEANKDGVIVNTAIRGNDCTATKESMLRMSNPHHLPSIE